MRKGKCAVMSFVRVRETFQDLTHTFFSASAPLTRQPYTSIWNLTYDHVCIPNCQIPFTKAHHSIRYIIHIIFIIYLPNTIHSLILPYIYIPAFRCTLSYAAHGYTTCGGNPWSPVIVPYYMTVISIILRNRHLHL